MGGLTNTKKGYQEELREKLASQGHLDRAVDIVGRMDKEGLELPDIQVLEKAFNARMRLVDKYLPSIKAVDLNATVDLDGEIHITWQAP
jgi:hypothetical protein